MYGVYEKQRYIKEGISGQKEMSIGEIKKGVRTGNKKIKGI